MIRPKKVSQPQAPRPLQSLPEIAVTGLGLFCAAGDQPFALLGAVGANLSGARLDPLQPGAGGMSPAILVPVGELEGVDHPAMRLRILAETALEGALSSLPVDSAGKILVALLLPGEETSRGETLDRPELAETLRSLHPELQKAEFRFLAPEAGAPAALGMLCRELAAGKWDAVLFGGADSLVDPITCQELAYAGRLLAEGETEGLAPGEAAAFLLLQPVGRAHEPKRVYARIAGAAQSPEPHLGQAADKKMTGLAQAMEEAAGQAGLNAADMKELILTLSTETPSQLEWHQTAMKLWPPRPPENEWDEPDDPEILRHHYALGELGAAAFPLALLLGCARFEFAHPPLTSLLVCDGGDNPVRGAVCLAR